MMDWGKIATSRPVNATAATVAGARGQGFTPSVTLQDWWADAKPMQPEHYYRVKLGDPSFIDWRGKTFGRLTVLGIAIEIKNNGGTSWQCRCVCGGYCSRRTKSLKILARGGNSIPDRCASCEYTYRLAIGNPPKKKATP
jgi:hypothetical protein